MDIALQYKIMGISKNCFVVVERFFLKNADLQVINFAFLNLFAE
jgi:hypothetical protein